MCVCVCARPCRRALHLHGGGSHPAASRRPPAPWAPPPPPTPPRPHTLHPPTPTPPCPSPRPPCPAGVEDNGSLTRVAAFPIGIDPDRFTEALEMPEVKANIAQLLNRCAFCRGHRLPLPIAAPSSNPTPPPRLLGAPVRLAPCCHAPCLGAPAAGGDRGLAGPAGKGKMPRARAGRESS